MPPPAQTVDGSTRASGKLATTPKGTAVADESGRTVKDVRTVDG